ncbi:MAG: histidine phosphatase family protein [Tannerellaceae bacterium]|jgi:broad specificity phosphatase PhoE|nr:histidine phosphatase family protein [Tannerellaceae bacterium]
MIEQLLRPYSEEDRISLLIRHADRYDFKEGTDGNEALLTEQGKINACKLGEDLSKYRVNKIITTPVPRCIQTGECIVKGYGKPVEISPSNLFGGLHIINWELANEFFNVHGYEKWYQNIIDDIPTPGIYSTEEYRKSMTDFLVRNTNKGLTIFISHDFPIAFYHYSINKTIYTIFSDWVKYLSGLILKNGQYVARFQNNE